MLGQRFSAPTFSWSLREALEDSPLAIPAKQPVPQLVVHSEPERTGRCTLSSDMVSMVIP